MRAERWILWIACLGSFMVVLDATIVSVALPDIRTELGFSSTALPWVVNAYTLAFAGFLPFGGRCIDVFGRRTSLQIGLGLFTLAMLGAALAPTPGLLLTARAMQGLGGALLTPVTLSMVNGAFTGSARTRAVGMLSAVGAVGAAAGPVIGGALTQLAGWRWIFLVSVPIGALGLLAANSKVPGMPRAGGRLDLVGALLATSGLSGVVYAVMESPRLGLVNPALIGGVVLLGVFLLHQGRWAAQPLVALDIFRSRAVSSANVVMFLLGMGFFASPILISLYLQDVRGYSPLAAGLGYLPVGAAMFLGARTAAGLTVRIGPRHATVLCCVIGTLGLAICAGLLTTHGPYVLDVLVPGAVFGFGTAAAFTPITVAATGGVGATRSGLAAGVLNTVRQTSAAFGLAALSAVVAAVPGEGYALAFGISALFLGCAAIFAAVAMPMVNANRHHA